MEKTRQTPSARRILGMVVGVIIIGLGIALFKQSHLGNDSITCAWQSCWASRWAR